LYRYCTGELWKIERKKIELSARSPLFVVKRMQRADGGGGSSGKENKAAQEGAREMVAGWGCTSSTQLTHSLKKCLVPTLAPLK
jgi:hypothetical protein